MNAKATSAKKTTPPVAAAKASAPRARKNGRRFDINPGDKTGTVLSTRVSLAMKKRALEAAASLGCSNHSELLSLALVRLFNQLEEIVKAYKDSGVVPMSLVGMKAFRDLGPAPEEIQYAAKWMPEKIERLGTRREEMEQTIAELQARLEEVERRLKIKHLEPQKKTNDQPMVVEVDLL